MDFCELNGADFENSIMKNSFIRSTDGEWIWFADSDVTCKADIEPILQENDFLTEYDTVLFCSEELDGEIGLLDLLINPQCVIYAFGVKRQMLVKTGSFNQLLEGCGNYEFLLRIVEKGTVFAISCSAEKKDAFHPTTMAYVYRRYMPVLKDAGLLDEVLVRMMQLADRHGVKGTLNSEMKVFLRDIAAYEKILEDTAPCLVLIGDDVCAGVLIGFANALADELVALGQAVITTDSRYGDYDKIPSAERLTQNYKVIIGFQASVFIEDILKNMKGRKMQFWFDDPVFFDGFFVQNSKENYILCQDADYADYIRKYYDIKNSMQFPPGGTVISNLPTEKIYDISFVGKYEPPHECIYEDEYESGFFEYMIAHPDFSFEQGILAYGKTLGVEYSKQEVVQQLQKVNQVCHDIVDKARHDTIEKIVGNGIKVHVFSDGWKEYRGKGCENLIIHPMVYGEEPYRIWAQSKIGLNIMHGHKAGMTERIANIMLCGACCLSDETTYLRGHFTNEEDIVLFKRTETDALPEKIRYLLEHDTEREQIAAAGREKAFREHTWRVRAEKLLELL